MLGKVHRQILEVDFDAALPMHKWNLDHGQDRLGFDHLCQRHRLSDPEDHRHVQMFAVGDVEMRTANLCLVDGFGLVALALEKDVPH